MKGFLILLGAGALSACGAPPPDNPEVEHSNMRTWSDPATGCIYYFYSSGVGQTYTTAMTIRYNADGTPDCPGALPYE